MDDCTKKRTLKITTTEQFEFLCREIKKYPEIASNKPVFGGSKAKIEGIWADITAKLNGLGPPQREVGEWKKVWAELKSRTKKKLSENHKSLTGTGGGPYQEDTLSPLEEMVDEAINIRSAALPPGNAIGLEENICPTSYTKADCGQTISKKRVADSTTDLLREQVNQQKKILTYLEELNATQKRIADSTEKFANIAEKFFNYVSSDE
ncbi:uncharacterized protein LOC111689910 [Lucilia cuprina]|uniref:uncharacterized protein LOC111689910 n=1 Tax=Lucilia cuprina TaxID=7375 RepID=UPI001F0652A8|nr:uncharacterized protein LOC111689910 [Lucilia cuprina]